MSGLIYAAALVACGAVTHQAAPAPAADDPIFRIARTALEVAPDKLGEIGLGEVLARFEELGDWSLQVDDETRARLGRTRFRASGPIHAEPVAVTGVVGALFANFGYCWSVVDDGGSLVLRVESLESRARNSGVAGVRSVDVSEIGRYADHPALFVQTLVPLEGLDAREIANSLRGLIVDPNMLGIGHAEGTKDLLLTGSGRHVASLVALLLAADARPQRVDLPRPAASDPVPDAVGAEGDFLLLNSSSEHPMTMLDFVFHYSALSGRLAVLDLEAASLLVRTRTGLPSTLAIPKAEFPELVEELLLENRFVLGELLLGDRAPFTVRSVDSAARKSGLLNARYVDPASLADCAAHPATLFATVIDLPHCDVRTLSNTLRGVVVDPSLCMIVPFGDSNALAIHGLGRRINRLVELLRTADAAAASRPAPVAPEVPAGGRK